MMSFSRKNVVFLEGTLLRLGGGLGIRSFWCLFGLLGVGEFFATFGIHIKDRTFAGYQIGDTTLLKLEGGEEFLAGFGVRVAVVVFAEDDRNHLE